MSKYPITTKSYSNQIVRWIAGRGASFPANHVDFEAFKAYCAAIDLPIADNGRVWLTRGKLSRSNEALLIGIVHAWLSSNGTK